MGVFARIWKLFKPEAIPGLAAGLYNKTARRLIPELCHGFVEDVVKQLPAGRLLDVGTGPGYVPIEIARRSKEVFVDGIDLTERMIEIARINAQEANLEDRLSFQVGDGKEMGFKDESYDMIISTASLHHWKDAAKVFNEMYRVLRPGGEAWVLDPCKDSTDREIDEFLEKIYKIIQPGFIRRLWISFFMRREIKLDAYSRAEVEEIVKRTRFNGCSIERDGAFMVIRLKKENSEKVYEFL